MLDLFRFLNLSMLLFLCLNFAIVKILCALLAFWVSILNIFTFLQNKGLQILEASSYKKWKETQGEIWLSPMTEPLHPPKTPKS